MRPLSSSRRSDDHPQNGIDEMNDEASNTVRLTLCGQ
jgi:hypothetical protein